MDDEVKLANVVVKQVGDAYQVTVNGIDVSDLVVGVDITLEGGQPAMVNLYVPAEVEFAVPADLEMYLVDVEEGEDGDATV